MTVSKFPFSFRSLVYHSKPLIFALVCRESNHRGKKKCEMINRTSVGKNGKLEFFFPHLSKMLFFVKPKKIYSERIIFLYLSLQNQKTWDRVTFLRFIEMRMPKYCGKIQYTNLPNSKLECCQLIKSLYNQIFTF